MRPRAAFAPDFQYPYLIDVVRARMAEAIVTRTDKTLTRRRHEKALVGHLDSMYASWNRVMWRRARWNGAAIDRLPFDDGADERTRYSLLVDAAIASPLDGSRRELTADERRAGLRALAGWLGFDEGWGDRALEIRDAAFAVHRERTRLFSAKRAAGLLPVALPQVILGHGDPCETTSTQYGEEGRPWLIAPSQPTDAGANAETALRVWDGHEASSRLVGLGPENAIAEIVRLQMYVGLVDAWALADAGAVNRATNALAERRAELAWIRADVELSEREQAEVAAIESAVERALTWLLKRGMKAVR